MKKIEINDAYFSEDNSVMIIEAKYENDVKNVEFEINDNFRYIFEYLDSEIITRSLFEIVAKNLDIDKNDIEYSKEDFEKIKNIIEIA